MGIVDACLLCNNGFSYNELYLACAVECAITGSTIPSAISRPVVRRALEEKPLLRARIQRSILANLDGTIGWDVERHRVESIIVKIARSHIRHEFNEALRDPPSTVSISPAVNLSREERNVFEMLTPQTVWPEVGRRDFVRRAKGKAREDEWRIIQLDRYRFWVTPSPLEVRIVLSEYLFARVIWA
jgi:hypothetical protein